MSGGATTSYGYDADGNLTQDGTATSSYNGQDQVTSSTGSSGTTAYSYDLNGSLSSQSGPGGTTAFTSDAFGQMITAGGETYGYDALGRLVTSATSSATTSMAYAGTSQQIASDGTDRYAYDPSGNETSAQAAGGTGYQVLADQHGDVTATFSPSATASTLAGWATYTPWGTATVNGTMPGIGYQGGYTDATTGLVRMGARWYDPSTGAFTSNDTLNGSPLPSTVDGNPYAYTAGNPLTETDPSGHCIVVCSAFEDIVSSSLADVDALGNAIIAAAPEITAVGGAMLVDGAEGALDGAVCGPWCMLGGFVVGAGIGAVAGYGAYEATSALLNRGTTTTRSPAGHPNADPNWNAAPGACMVGCGVNYNFGTSGGGGGGGGGCTPIICPPAKPKPPPPPPQNCYEAHLCNPTHAPGSLTHNLLITAVKQGLRSIASLFGHGNGIIENANKSEKATDGTQPNSNILPEKNNQEEEAKGPQLAEAGAGAGSMKGGGNCTGNGLSAAGALRDAAVEVHNLATPRIRFNQSTVALAEVTLADGSKTHYASASAGRLSDAQVRLLQQLGVPEANILTGARGHAEANIFNAMLPPDATINRWGIAWGSTNNPNPCPACAAFVTGNIEGAC